MLSLLAARTRRRPGAAVLIAASMLAAFPASAQTVPAPPPAWPAPPASAQPDPNAAPAPDPQSPGADVSPAAPAPVDAAPLPALPATSDSSTTPVFSPDLLPSPSSQQGAGALPAPDGAAESAASEVPAGADPQPPAQSWRGWRKKRKGPHAPRTPEDDAELARWDDHRATQGRASVAQLFGLNLFGWPYLASALVGGLALETKSPELEPLGFLYVPAIGPFLAMATLDGLDDTGRNVLLVDGALQSAGVLVFLLAMPFTRDMPAAPRGSGVAAAPALSSLQVAPVVTPSFAGVGLRGSF